MLRQIAAPDSSFTCHERSRPHHSDQRLSRGHIHSLFSGASQGLAPILPGTRFPATSGKQYVNEVINPHSL